MYNYNYRKWSYSVLHVCIQYFTGTVHTYRDPKRWQC